MERGATRSARWRCTCSTQTYTGTTPGSQWTQCDVTHCPTLLDIQLHEQGANLGPGHGSAYRLVRLPPSHQMGNLHTNKELLLQRHLCSDSDGSKCPHPDSVRPLMSLAVSETSPPPVHQHFHGRWKALTAPIAACSSTQPPTQPCNGKRLKELTTPIAACSSTQPPTQSCN